MSFQEPFQPRFIAEAELVSFGLPSRVLQPNIMGLVDAASSLIDETCGRTDGDGNGSLVYTTYSHRLIMPEGRNIVRLFFRPLASLSVSLQQELQASGTQYPNFYTGFVPNTTVSANVGTLSPIISASGRYGYGRRGAQNVYPDMNYGANIMQIAAFFGGPPTWTGIDVSMIDFDPRTGEIWLPAGLYLSQYSEVVITYNSGFDPRAIPRAIKNATAMAVRNILAMGGGTTNLKSLTSGRVGAAFGDSIIDKTIESMLRSFYTVIGY